MTGLVVGDAVFGVGDATFAEYARTRPARLAAKPAYVTFDQAAAVPVPGLTALQAVRDHGQVQAGHTVLVIGASGGVGSFAVQIAKLSGPRSPRVQPSEGRGGPRAGRRPRDEAVAARLWQVSAEPVGLTAAG